MSGPALACRWGHPYTPQNTRLARDSRGYLHKRCRACDRDAHRSLRAAACPASPARAWSPPPAWTELALCATADPDAWFPAPHDAKGAARAKAICATCPVKADCLAHALAAGEKHGIWGGLDECQRAALPADRRAAA